MEQRVDMGFGVSVKGLIMENAAQIIDNNFKHFALL